MNQYKILVKGADPLGIQFIKNVAELASKGATISQDHPINNKFPHSLVMIISTEDELVTDMKKGYEVFPMIVPLSKDELEALEWEDFKRVLRKQFGITGRDRSLMTVKYLQATGQAE